jgi:hypothetical protein
LSSLFMTPPWGLYNNSFVFYQQSLHHYNRWFLSFGCFWDALF